MNLATAKALPLMGQPGSWHNHARKPIGKVPGGVLKSAQRFFMGVRREGANARIDEQLEAIALVLADYDANSPQQSLLLEVTR